MKDFINTAGVKTFLVIWFGQLVSTFGSGLTNFALGVWIYQKTGEVTSFGLVLIFITLPPILLAPFSGVVIDRYNRRWIMIISDSVSALSTLAVALLLFTDTLEVWHIYLATGISATVGSFQWPAYIASISLMVPSEHLGRANGLGELSRSLSQLLSPVLAGFLLIAIQLEGIIFIDFVTFLCALTSLLFVRIPQLKSEQDDETTSESMLSAITFGWRYLAQRPGLLSLLLYFTAVNFLVGGIEVLVTPLALSFTTVDVLGTILFVGGMGMVTGSILISMWGGPSRKIYAVLGTQLIGGCCLIIVGFFTNIYILAAVAFIFFFGIPVGDTATNVILQNKVAPKVQGRVFTMVGAIAGGVLPLAYLIIGWLADNIFEPMMQPGGRLATVFGPVIGVGEGRGIGLLFVIMGAFTVIITILAYQYPRLRLVDVELPDHSPYPEETPHSEQPEQSISVET